MILGRDGYSSANFVGDFRAESSSSGGGVSISGRISLEAYKRDPLAYTAGGEWFATRAETGGIDAWGILNEPSIQGGIVELTARGPAILAEREIHNRLYQSRSLDDWEPADSDPHEYASNKHIEVNVHRGKVKWRPQKDFAYSGSEQSGVIFWEPGDHLTRVSFKIKKTEDDAGWELVLYGANVEEDGLGASLTELQTWGLGAGNPDGTLVEEDIGGDYDLIRLSLRKVGAGTPTDPPRFWVTKLRVNGAAPDDDFTASDFVRDLCALLDWDDSEVMENGYPMLPHRIEGETFRDQFDYVSLVTGWRVVARRVGRKIVCNFGPWNQRVWTLIDPTAPRNYVALERYNVVPVVYKWAGGNATGVVKAKADPDPLKGATITAPPVELSGKLPTKSQAEDIAQRLADFHAEPKLGGDVECAYVLDEQGLEHPAQDIREGDTLYDPIVGMKLKIDRVERGTGPVVRVSFLSEPPFVSKLDARRARRLARLVS